MYEQLDLWDILSKAAPEEAVKINGALNVRAMPISQFDVKLPYGDLVLLVAMVEDYVRGLDEALADDIQWNCYYRKRFKRISESIQRDIVYDYEKKRKACLKQKKDSDIGEDALVLAIKKR